ncbi:hypothetical protein, partial [Streptococcus pyogenes]|uniref:hypothetical protein n=1 Tax=Streptococcus pyogenes TaxID=1314 RepID=UPI003DA0583E
CWQASAIYRRRGGKGFGSRFITDFSSELDIEGLIRSANHVTYLNLVASKLVAMSDLSFHYLLTH